MYVDVCFRLFDKLNGSYLAQNTAALSSNRLIDALHVFGLPGVFEAAKVVQTHTHGHVLARTHPRTLKHLQTERRRWVHWLCDSQSPSLPPQLINDIDTFGYKTQSLGRSKMIINFRQLDAMATR